MRIDRPVHLAVALAVALAGCEAAPAGAAHPSAIPSPPLNSRQIEFASTIDGGGIASETIGGSGFIVLDSFDKALYVYDQDRGRFIGPAFSVQGVPPRVLAGYPFPVGPSSPQGGLIDGQTVWVADGASALILKMTIDHSGVTAAQPISLDGAVAATGNTEANGVSVKVEPGRDFMAYIALRGPNDLLAFSEDVISHQTYAYEFDSSGRTTRSKQLLAKGYIQGSAKIADRLMVAFDNGLVGTLAGDLSFSPLTKLPTSITSLAAVGRYLVASTASPASLYRIDPTSGTATRLASVSTAPYGGQLVVDGQSVWWPLSKAGQMLKVSLAGAIEKSIVACPAIEAAAALGKVIGVLCGGPPRLALIDRQSFAVRIGLAGNYPIGLVPFVLS